MEDSGALPSSHLSQQAGTAEVSSSPQQPSELRLPSLASSQPNVFLHSLHHHPSLA